MIDPRITFLGVYLGGFLVVTELLNPFVWTAFDLVYPSPSTQFCFAIQKNCEPNLVPNSFWFVWFFQKIVIIFSAVAIWQTIKGKGKRK